MDAFHLGEHGLQTSPTKLDHNARWTSAEKLLLVVLGGVVFLDTLDLSLVQVALPSIGSSLRLPAGQLQWIVSAFVLGYGGFLLFGGRSADVFGRRRVLVWGLVALIAASILGAVATDGSLLIVARFIKGMTAAFTAPAALSILTTSFAEGHRRNRALGVHAAAAACAVRRRRDPRGPAARPSRNPPLRAADPREPRLAASVRVGDGPQLHHRPLPAERARVGPAEDRAHLHDIEPRHRRRRTTRRRACDADRRDANPSRRRGRDRVVEPRLPRHRRQLGLQGRRRVASA